jgi:hypothetical protein
MGTDRHMWASRHDLGIWMEFGGFAVGVGAIVIAVKISRQRRDMA